MIRHLSFLGGLRRVRNASRALRYTTAIALVVLAIAVAALTEPVLQRAPTAPLFAAILAAGWLAGFGPAIAVAAIGVVVLDRMAEMSITALHIDARDVLWMVLFSVIALGMAWLASNIRRLEDAQEQLLARERQARTEAQAAIRTKDDFLAVVSHELRSPLTVILTWVHLLKSGKVGPSEVERAVETIERSTVLQAKLIEDLLDASRAGAGKLDVVMHRVDLAELVRQAVDSLQPKAQAARLVVEIAIAPGLHVRGDAARLQQVIMNLLSNAIKFTPPAGRVHVQTHWADGYAELLVRDTGEGIGRATLPYVFEPFYQGPPSPQRQEGLGLGLAIAKHIVELHGGSIAADSSGLGRGATFTVRLPLDA